MSKQLKMGYYVTLLMINTLLAAMGGASVGAFLQYQEGMETAMIRLDTLKRNKLKVYDYIKSNCTQLLVEYPEFNLFPTIDLCAQYGLAIKFGKFVIFLSSLYNIFLPFLLYGPPLIPVILTSFGAIFVFVCSNTSNHSIVFLSEMTTILVGFFLINIQFLVPDLDETLERKYQHLRRWIFNTTGNDHIYDNVYATER